MPWTYGERRVCNSPTEKVLRESVRAETLLRGAVSFRTQTSCPDAGRVGANTSAHGDLQLCAAVVRTLGDARVQDFVTVKTIELLVPPPFVTDRSYMPGVIKADTMAQGGVAFRHGGFVAVGTTNTIVVPFALTIFGYALAPKLMVFPLPLNPVPVMVTRVSTGPASGWRVVMVGVDDGAPLPSALHATRTTAAMHAYRAVLMSSADIPAYCPTTQTA